MKEFDISTVEDETHLRKLIMDRVLETATEFATVSVHKIEIKESDFREGEFEEGKFQLGERIPLKDLPENERMEQLNRFMLQTLEHFDGPGPALRLSIARLILDYRLLPRLKETLATLYPSSAKHERVLKSIRHVESQIAMGMFSLYVWPMREDDKRKKEFQEIRAKLLGNALENPEAFMGKE
jgi:hypothetical protein